MGFRGQVAQQQFQPVMTALGQKRTLEHVRVMSALPPKADIGTQSVNVRFVPGADKVHRGKGSLLDHLVGTKDKRLGKGDTDRFCGFAI